MDRSRGSTLAQERTRGAFRAWVATGLSGIAPGLFAVTSWWLALVAIWVLQQAHIGLHEHHELPPLLHLLRDGALTVPSAAIALALAACIFGDRLRRSTFGARAGLTNLDRVRWAVLVAVLFALLSVPGSRLHAFLFGAEAEEIGWLADATLDTVIGFIGALIALLPIAIVVGPPVRRPLVAGRHGPKDVTQRSAA